MGAAEFGEPRREPERSEPLGAGELHLGGGAHAVDVAGHERDAELLLELGDAVAQPVDRQPELERGRAEAAVLDHLQEGVDVFPGGQATAGAGALPSAGRITPTPPNLHTSSPQELAASELLPLASLQLRREKGL